MAGTSAGSVHCTSPATTPVAGLRTTPVPDRSGVLARGVVAVISAMLAALCDLDLVAITRAAKPGASGRHQAAKQPRQVSSSPVLLSRPARARCPAGRQPGRDAGRSHQ